jgi:diacylglycerol kinase (ATP)
MADPLTSITAELKRIIRAFGYSIEGLKAGWNESAFRTEIIITAFALPIAFFVTEDTNERALLIGSLFMVLIVELLNTAVEVAINRISTEIHPLSKKAKDIASAAVLLSLINATLIWLVVLWN